MTLEALFQLEDTARARTTDPDTSHRAAEVASPTVMPSQEACIRILRLWGKPMTIEQIASAAADLGVPNAASRMRSTPRELERKGITKIVGQIIPTGKKSPCNLWALTGEDDA